MQQEREENSESFNLIKPNSVYRNVITDEIAEEIEAEATPDCACGSCCWYRNTAQLVRMFKCH